MSQRGRIIGREKSIPTIIKRNPNVRICPVLTIFGMIVTLSMIFQSDYGILSSIMPILGMLVILQTIDGSILHVEVKSMRHILLFLLLIRAIWVGLFVSNLNIFAPLLDFPILLTWGVFFYRIGSLFRCNTFLIPNEVLGKLVIIINWIAGILFLAAGIGDMGAFLGLAPPIPLISTIARLSGCAAGLMIAVLCSFSNRVFLNQSKKEKK